MSKIKILIVEDELIAANNIAKNLEKQGYDVVGIVNSGEKAIAKVTETFPNLILMDIQLRGKLNGIETAEIVRDKFQIPIVFITAYADGPTIQKAKLVKPHGYLVKPFKPQDLGVTIELALHKYQSEQELLNSLLEVQEMNDLKSNFMAVTAHDLKNFMSSILVSSDLLRKFGNQLTEVKRNELLQNIAMSVENMNDILEDMLLVQRLEAGKIICQSNLVNLTMFCRRLINCLQMNMKDHQEVELVDITPAEQKDEFFSHTYLDIKILRHILLNLLSNAIKYSPDGQNILLEINCQPEQVTFRVQDKGIGMPASYQHKLFQMFERAENVDYIPGTGLGLYIVKQLTDIHKGEVHVESQQGLGTTITVTLPYLPPPVSLTSVLAD
jgi:signal transduction histidine kinase